jgi:RNA polymerase sigma-70 factor (ECF subfamily)
METKRGEDSTMGGSTITALSAGAASPATGDQDIAQALSAKENRLALGLCARHHGAAIGRLCMALVGTQAEAEDLAQETLLAAHDAFEDFRGDGSIRAWLFAIARKKCARHLERRVRRESRLRLVHDATRTDAADDQFHRRQRAERARAALEQIRPSEREAVVLRYAAELSFREVGEACGIDEAAARKRVSRALARLRDALVKE